MNKDDETPCETLDSLEEKIIQQVEYYFGDVNLPRDRFLQEQIKKNSDGWVSMETMLRFNRLKCLSSDEDVILRAVQKSTTKLLDIDVDEKKIRRSVNRPLPDNSLEYWKGLKTKTIYVKGFPKDAKLDDVQEFLQKYGGKVDNIVMRRTNTEDRLFKGSVFVTFTNKEACEKFLSESPARYPNEEADLIKMWQEKYHGKKGEQRKQAKMEAKLEKQKQLMKYKTGLLLRVKNIPTNVNPRHLKELLQELGKVVWVEVEKEADQGIAEFDGQKDTAKTALEKLAEREEPLKINDSPLEFQLVEGDEEATYFAQRQVKKRTTVYDRREKFKTEKKRKTEWKGKRVKFNEDGDGDGEKNGDQGTSQDSKAHVQKPVEEEEKPKKRREEESRPDDNVRKRSNKEEAEESTAKKPRIDS